MLVYLRDGSAQTILRAATPRWKIQIQFSTSPSHSILTPGSTSASADPTMPGAWQGSHWSANFLVTGMTRPGKKPRRKRDSNPGSSAPEANTLTTRPTRRFSVFYRNLQSCRKVFKKISKNFCLWFLFVFGLFTSSLDLSVFFISSLCYRNLQSCRQVFKKISKNLCLWFLFAPCFPWFDFVCSSSSQILSEVARESAVAYVIASVLELFLIGNIEIRAMIVTVDYVRGMSCLEVSQCLCLFSYLVSMSILILF